MGGLGGAISRRLHDAGLVVAVSYSARNSHVAQWLRAEGDAGRTFHAFELDVASYESCDECMRRVLAEFGAIDVLINDAGITRDASFLKLTKQDWDEVLHTDLDSMFNLTKPL
jgi:acetoacetyl-CoA reductase